MRKLLLLSFFVFCGTTMIRADSGENVDENRSARVTNKIDSIFPRGNKNTSPNFRGDVWVKGLVQRDEHNDTEIGNVTFAPGARSKWHLHPAGQILLVTEGIGYYQEKGKPKRILKKGDVVKCAPNVPHWHGASKDAAFIQLAVTSRSKGATQWLDHVTDAEYHAGAQTEALVSVALSARHQNIAAIAAHTAKGNVEALKPALHTALDSGLTVNEIKEVLVHLAAYCGFPRSLNGINAFIVVTDDRKAKGINDPTGNVPAQLAANADKYQVGKANLESLTGRAEQGPKTGYAAFVPIIDTFLKEHLFADIFSRGVLSSQDRELTTVAALASLGGVESQLRGHLSISFNIGFNEIQLTHLISIVEKEAGETEGKSPKAVLDAIVVSRKKSNG